MTLEGRVAIVTGSSRGIGADVAKYLARAGAKVAICARSEESPDPRLPGTIYSVVKEIEAEGGAALPVRMNMRDPDDIRNGVQRVADEWGRIDIAVNNAAILIPGDIETVQERHLELMWQVDLRGPVLLMQAVIPHMKRAGGGHIINVSSRGGVFPGPGPYADTSNAGAPFYGMVKSGLEHLSQRVAIALQDSNISVNVLSPNGFIRTPGSLMARSSREDPETEFDTAEYMGKGAVWICEQPPKEFTGNILFDELLCKERGL